MHHYCYYCSYSCCITAVTVIELVHEDAPHWGYGGVTFEKCMV
jgi:hypothetical protein